ncbi:MAG: FliM/FliN family flagellar motor switch protein [Bryobacteraceae bacterium]|jgi:flagellar motor switch protein FliN/FliY
MSTHTDDKSPLPDRAQMATRMMASWLDSLITVLESMTGYRPKAESHASPSNEVKDGLAWRAQSLNLLEEPSFWIGAPAESWAGLSRLTLAALGVNAPTDHDIQSTCRDLMAQTSSIVASQLTCQFGKEISGGDSIPNSQPNRDGALVFSWSLDAGLASVEGAAVWSEALLRRCADFTVQQAAVKAGSAEATPASSSETVEFGGRTLDSIPRLDLRVNFILGRTTLPLRDVFKLTVGSVIELDRSVVDPVDVVIRNRVLARGHVVVVDGNYGLKILSHQQ